MTDLLADSPIIAAVREDRLAAAIASPAKLIFWLNANVLTVGDQINAVHAAGKKLFIHLDLAEGIGKDKAGIEYLAQCGVDGIISTRAGLIRFAKERRLTTVQRIFALDSQGVAGAAEVIRSAAPDFVEIMPGIADKVIARTAKSGVPVIAGGLIETKAEIIAALDAGALAVSTGKSELWGI